MDVVLVFMKPSIDRDESWESDESICARNPGVWTYPSTQVKLVNLWIFIHPNTASEWARSKKDVPTHVALSAAIMFNIQFIINFD